MRPRLFVAGVLALTGLLGGGCATDSKSTTAGQAAHVYLSADREPFTFSSWDVGRVEWSAPANDPRAVPPHAAAVLSNHAVLPLRELTLDRARHTPGLTVGPPARVDDGHGAVYAVATPATGSGFHFDFAGDRLVHFVAAAYDDHGNPGEPVFQALDVSRTDAYGDVKQYALPLGHDGCVDLFGGANGLETDLRVPPLLP